jgi:hypothetical protein
MQQTAQEPEELLAEPTPEGTVPGGPSLVEVLTDFLRGASRYVLEEDGDFDFA